MTIFKHELRTGKLSLLIWSLGIAFMMAVCILIYPEMGSQMDEMGDMFAEMGGFTAAFGMDRINFGEFSGFFGVECGNILGLGGAFFAALIGISALAKEERDHTAEFLLTHPVSRGRVITEKLAAVLAQLVILNLITLAVTLLCMKMIGETMETKSMALLLLAYFLLQVEIAAVTFGISAFLSRGSLGIGLGLAALSYFVNIISNLTEEAKALKYITPFGYAEAADILADGELQLQYLAVGMVIAVAAVVAAYWKYGRKDVR